MSDEEVKVVVGQRVLHRRADLFGRVERIEGTDAFVKYEWPWDPDAPPEKVPADQLTPATDGVL